MLALALAAIDPGAVVARVGSDVIDGRDVVGRAHALHVRPSAALEDLIRESLAASLARSAGLESAPAVRDELEAERRRVAVEQLLEREVASKVKVTDADVARRFHATQDQVRLSMVVRATEREAREVLERLAAGSGVIEEARSSIDPAGRAKSGVMGWFHRSELSRALAQAAFAAPLDRPTGPVRVEQGYAAIVVHERRVGDDDALRRAAAEIRRELEQVRWEERAGTLLRALRARAGARVDAAALRSTGNGLRGVERPGLTVATDGERPVTYREVVARMREGAGGAAAPADASPEAKERAAWRLVDERLLAREAVRRGLHRAPETTCAVRGATRTVLASAYARSLAAQVSPPTEAEIAARYQARTDDYWVPAHRMCTLLDARDEQHASELRKRLLAGEPVERVGGEYASPTAPSPTQPVRFTDAGLDAMSTDQSDQHVLAWTIRKATPGEWNVAETRGHWHLVRCDARQPTRRRTLAEAHDEIVASIRQERVAQVLEARVAEQRRVTRIRTYPAALSDDP